MTVSWGVDSATPANWPVGGRTLFDQVTQWAGGIMPSFWGRYIGGQFALNKAEVDFIFNKSQGTCKVLVIYNGATATSVGGGYGAGATDAAKAIQAAQTGLWHIPEPPFPIPPSVWLYADIETNWRVDPGWFIGWWETMSASDYANPGGFYCNPLPTNAVNFNIPFMQAWTTTIDAQGKPLYNSYLYSCQPQQGCSYYNPSVVPMIPTFLPATVPLYTGPMGIWQYAVQCKISGIDVDLDLATDDAYDTMWG